MTATQEALPFHYPDAPGWKGTSTSRAASIIEQERAAYLRPRCLAVLAEGNFTADEIAERLGQTAFAIRPRLSELRAQGKVADSGNRRENASGHNAIVWRLA